VIKTWIMVGMACTKMISMATMVEVSSRLVVGMVIMIVE